MVSNRRIPHSYDVMFLNDVIFSIDMSIFACSTLKKVEKPDFGGRGACCCVLQCKSAFYDSQGKKSGIGLFKIPKDIARLNKWSKIFINLEEKVLITISL